MFIGFKKFEEYDLSTENKIKKEYEKYLRKQGDYSSLTCPSCGSKGTLTEYSFYPRKVIASPEMADHPVTIVIVRLICNCETCKHTHALLPAWLCPYCSLTYPFIIQILKAYYGELGEKISAAASRFNLNRAVIRNLIKKFSRDILTAKETELARQTGKDPDSILSAIASGAEKLHNFLVDFAFRIHKSFLTRHFNIPYKRAAKHYAVIFP